MVRWLAWPAGIVNYGCMLIAAWIGDIQTFTVGLVGGSFAAYAWLYYVEEMEKMEKYGYRDIASRLRWDIKEEGLVPGQRLPSVAELTTRFRCSRVTVGRALKTLADEGFVEVIHGRGTYVLAGDDKGTRTDIPRDLIIAELTAALADKPSGSQLVQAQDIASQYRVAPMTVRRALNKMLHDGLIVRTPDGRFAKP